VTIVLAPSWVNRASQACDPYHRGVPATPADLVTAAIVELVDGLPSAVASVKSPDGRYVHVTEAFAERVGRRSVAEVIGRTVHELFPPDLAASYAAQDEIVLTTGKPLHDHLEVIEHVDGSRRWYVTSKVRLLASEPPGPPLVVGVASMSVDLRSPDAGDLAVHHRGLATALDHVRAHLDARLGVDDLAARASLTRAQLDRACRRALGASITAVVRRIRLDEAMHRLSHTEQPIGDVAAACGFYDQSELTRRFRSATGVTPARYRDLHSVPG
jgi:PAS domain S-box-containing protein